VINADARFTSPRGQVAHRRTSPGRTPRPKADTQPQSWRSASVGNLR